MEILGSIGYRIFCCNIILSVKNMLIFFKKNPPQPTFVTFSFVFSEIEAFTANDYRSSGWDTSKIQQDLTDLKNDFTEVASSAINWAKS